MLGYTGSTTTGVQNLARQGVVEGSPRALSGHRVPIEIVKLAESISNDVDSDERAATLAGWLLGIVRHENR